MACGLLQKSSQRFVGHTQFYEEQYQNYYERPNIERFDRDRYIAMGEWMKAALGADFAPSSILDVGCGAGLSMQTTRQVYPTARISGVEPSTANAQKAQAAGFDVVCGRFGGGAPLPAPYDLIYANNVLQHITELAEFFRDLEANLSANGRVAMVLPDATDPSNEMLWRDHNFSFRPRDLVTLAEAAGLCVCNWQANPPNNSLLDKQLVVLAKAGSTAQRAQLPEVSLSNEELFQRRSAYMARWQTIDAELVLRTAGYNRVFNFGASMWSWLLAGYCQTYWQSVSHCLVDGGGGSCMDKIVASPSDVALSRDDCVVMGVNPANQADFERKLGGLGSTIVGWSDLVIR
ncbi:class I SAM-dependent methyltransferase [Bradyrhizobium sp. UFLA05-153]